MGIGLMTGIIDLKHQEKMVFDDIVISSWK